MEGEEAHLPVEVSEIALHAIDAVKSHPQHYLEWEIRQKLYKAFGPFTDRKVQLVRGWLAVLAAQKVLPIFTNQLPYYALPLQLIGTAIDELSPYIDANSKYDEDVQSAEKHAERADELLETAYHTLGNELLEDYDGHLFPNADMVATAAWKALQEAKGWEDPFEHIEHFYKGSEKDYSEEEWVHLAAVGDTAGASAQAYASGPDSQICDKVKLKEFWIWWLKKALPEAWKLAAWEWVSK